MMMLVWERRRSLSVSAAACLEAGSTYEFAKGRTREGVFALRVRDGCKFACIALWRRNTPNLKMGGRRWNLAGLCRTKLLLFLRAFVCRRRNGT